MSKQIDLVLDLKLWADLELEFGSRLKATRINNVAIKYFKRLTTEDKIHVLVVVKENHQWWQYLKNQAEIINKQL